MKVKEVAEQLKVGDVVWVKAEIVAKDQTYAPIQAEMGAVFGSAWLRGYAEISLTEPKATKVEVPQFVAELLDYYKDSADVDLLVLLVSFNAWYCRQDKNGEHEEAIDWLVKNPEKFMRAWMDGYIVKQEPKYYVALPSPSNILHYLHMSAEGHVNFFTRKDCPQDKCRFSKDEVTEIDERYWAFAVPVDGSVEEV